MTLRYLGYMLAFTALTGCVSTNLADRELEEISVSRPLYPNELRETGIRGEVIVEFTVGSDGVVKAAQIFRSTHPAFNKPALDSIYKWQFRPRVKNGRPIEARVQQTLYFYLDDEKTPVTK